MSPVSFLPSPVYLSVPPQDHLIPRTAKQPTISLCVGVVYIAINQEDTLSKHSTAARGCADC